MYETITKDFMKFVEGSPTPFHVVNALSKDLLKAGFTELNETEIWKIKAGKSYFVTRNSSSLIAFKVPKNKTKGLNIIAAHTDSPALKVKGLQAEMSDGSYLKLNVECYGGLLMSTWFDRPLSLAGRVMVREKGSINEKLINIDRDLLIIPSVAIHMNRNANKGIEYNPQVDLLPLFSTGELEDSGSNVASAKSALTAIIANELDVDPNDILSCDLFIYNRTPGSIWGLKNEFFSTRQIDDLQCLYGAYRGFMDASLSEKQTSMPVIAFFDNEEVGSTTKQGADSTFLDSTLSRMAESMGLSNQELNAIIAGSLLISADNAHAVHPNHPEYHDPKNRPVINGGIVIKHAANQHYTTDSISAALFKEICSLAKVPFQEFYNRSDTPGGGTLGNISNSHVSLNSVDIGLPQLAMHSCYETAGVKDTEYLVKASKVFFSKSLIHKDGYSFK